MNDEVVIGYGKIFPSGNASNFPRMRKQLEKLEIAYTEYPMKGGGAVFVIPYLELPKLPVWKNEPYLPVADDGGGHSIYAITQEDIDLLD